MIQCYGLVSSGSRGVAGLSSSWGRAGPLAAPSCNNTSSNLFHSFASGTAIYTRRKWRRIRLAWLGD